MNILQNAALLLITSTAFSCAYAQTTTDETSAGSGIGSYCIKDRTNKGIVKNLWFEYAEGTLMNGVPRRMCQITNGDNMGLVDAGIFFSKDPSIAATYLSRGVAVEKLPPFDPNKWATPSHQFCALLNGIEMSAIGGWVTSKHGAQNDLCTFADGSALSIYTLIYTSMDRKFLGIVSKIKATPLNINLPYSR